jgi:hypothetical protein
MKGFMLSNAAERARGISREQMTTGIAPRSHGRSSGGGVLAE